MSQLNIRTKLAPIYTAEGAPAKHIGPQQQLLRLTMSCMLWEDGFYVDGKTIAEQIAAAVHACTLEQAALVAMEARNNMKLRHVPLLIVREMARHPKRDLITNRSNGANHTRWVSNTLADVIQRPDELTEFLAIYWKDSKQPLSKQVKLGLAKAFAKFDEYALAKYNRKKDVSLKDVLFLCHSKPVDAPVSKWTKTERQQYPIHPTEFAERGFSEGELLYGKLIYDQLQTPDTWETQLSAGADKGLTFIRLMNENKLGDLAFLRNLRNMVQAGVPEEIIVEYGNGRNWGRVLPFRFISAARIMPQFEPHLERWMFKCLEGSTKLEGKTILLVDVSGSMQAQLSQKSDLKRTDAAQALAMLLREVCAHPVIVPFGDEKLSLVPVPPRRGFALADLVKCQNTGTKLGAAVNWANIQRYDRLIVLTDEQSFDVVGNPLPGKHSYMLNVASEKNGVGYGPWLHIDGFSEACVDYITEYEASNV